MTYFLERFDDDSLFYGSGKPKEGVGKAFRNCSPRVISSQARIGL
jgi:hypothetical protein